MEKRKNVAPAWLSIVLAVLCGLSILSNVWMLINNDKFALGTYRVATCVDTTLFALATVLGIHYGFKGYKKEARRYFKLFSIMLTAALLLQVVLHTLCSATSTVIPAAPDAAVSDTSTEAVPDASAEAVPDASAVQLPELPADGERPELVGSILPSSLVQYTPAIQIICSAIMLACMSVLTIAENLGRTKSFILVGIVILMALISTFSRIDINEIRTILFNVNFSTFINAVIYGIMVYAKYLDKVARGRKV